MIGSRIGFIFSLSKQVLIKTGALRSFYTSSEWTSRLIRQKLVAKDLFQKDCTFATSATLRTSTHPESHNDGRQSKALVLLSDLKKLKSSPRPILLMAFCGLSLFALPPIYFISTQQFITQFATMQLLYGAVILSFLGGTHWGCFLQSGNKLPAWLSPPLLRANIKWSLIPSTIGLISIYLPVSVGLLSQIVGHGLLTFHDITTSVEFYPSWFRAVRFVFMLVTILMLWTSCICRFAFEEHKKDEKNTETKPV